MTKEQTIKHWEQELQRAESGLETSEKYDDRGGIEWYTEQIRWIRNRLNDLYQQ